MKLAEWGRFWAVLLSLITLFGGLVLAAEKNLEVHFLILVLLAGTVAFGPRMSRRVGDWVTAVRNYPSVLDQVVDLTEERDVSHERVKDLEGQLLHSYVDGIGEGRAQIASAGFSVTLDELPELTAVLRVGDETRLLCKYSEDSPVRPNVRFRVGDENTGDVKGAVKVEAVRDETGEADLVCIEKTNEGFWERLRERAELDSTIPPGIHLLTYEIEPLDEIKRRIMRSLDPEAES